MKTWRQIAVLGMLALLPFTKASAGAEADPLTPSAAEIVVQVNVRSLLQTPLVKKHALDSLKAILRRNNEARQFLDAAGLDPLKDIDTFALSSSGNPLAGGKIKMLVVIRGNFAPDKVQAASEDYAKKHPDRLKICKSGALSLWELSSRNNSLYAALAGSNTLVMATTKQDTAAAVHRVGQTRQRLSAEMQTALAHLRGDESVWMAMVATDPIKQLLRADPRSKDFAAALQSITGALEMDNDAQFGLVVHTSSPAAAAQIKRKLDDVMPLLGILGTSEDKSAQLAKEVLDNIKLTTEKNDVSIRLRITETQLDKAGKKKR